MRLDTIRPLPSRPSPPARRRGGVRRSVVAAVLAGGLAVACGGGGDDDTARNAVEASGDDNGSSGGRGATSDRPSGSVPVAPHNNDEVSDPEAIGTRRAAMPPGQWFEYERGYYARIASVRAARDGEVEVQATGGGASVLTIQVYYDGDEPSSSSRFRPDTTLYNEASCTDQGAGHGDITMDKGETVEILYCAHLSPRGNGVALYSYVDNRQSWGAWYAIIGPEGVIEPVAAPTTARRPRL